MAILLPPLDLLPPHSGQSSLLMGLPDGPAGIAVTLNQMVAWTRAYRTDPYIHQLASSIVAPLMGKDYMGEASAVQDFVRNNIRYTRDIFDVETLQSPLITLERGQGDCDDMALLAGTLLQAVGHPVRYVAFAFTGPDAFDHVYVETLLGTRWVGVETTEPVPLGWTPPDAVDWKVRTVH